MDSFKLSLEIYFYLKPLRILFSRNKIDGWSNFCYVFCPLPYIYLISKLAFLSTPISLYELAKMHGKSSFFNVALPMSRPAIVAGLSLVLMETISDFGTVEVFCC